MKQYHLSVCILFVLLFGSCARVAATTAPAPTEVPATPTTIPATPTEAFRSMNTIKIDAPSLANNLVGEPTERTINVYLPPSYASSEKRYPVVYYLPGYGDSSVIGFRLPGTWIR